MNYGYIRVSSKDQNEERQLYSLLNLGIEKDKIYKDKISGKDFNRPGYNKLIKKLKKHDVLYISSIDRLGRNYNEILEQWRILTKDKQVYMVVLDMPLLDTRNSKDLTNTLIADIVLQLLSYVAQKEREFIKQRQKEGIIIAKQKGIKFGRPIIPLPDNFIDIYNKYTNKQISCSNAAKLLNMPESTFRYKVKKYMESISN